MIKTLHEILKASPDMTYNEATKVQEDMRLAIEDKVAGEKESVKKYRKGVCVTAALKKDLKKNKEIDYHRYWKSLYEEEHKLRQETEATIKKLQIENDLLRDKLQVKELQTTTNQ